MTFEDLIYELAETRKLATQDPGNNPANYVTKLGKIKKAQEKMVELFYTYRKQVEINAVIMITGGKKAEEFANLAKDECGCFAVSLDEMFNVLMEEIGEENYKNRAASAVVFEILNINLDILAERIGIQSVPYVNYNTKYNKTLKTLDDVVQLAKDAILELEDGALLPIFYAIDKVATQAVNEEYEGKNIPIVLYTEDMDLLAAAALSGKKLNPNTFVLNIGGKVKDFKKIKSIKIDEVSSESVEKTLLDIRDRIV
jgi:hypothetical protein